MAARAIPQEDDSRDNEWVYPGVSWFKLSTVQETARQVGLNALVKSEYTQFYVRSRPNECHDWIRFTSFTTTSSRLMSAPACSTGERN
jgi:hypothetical protein